MTRREVPLTLSIVIHHSTDTSCYRAVLLIILVCKYVDLSVATDAGRGSSQRIKSLMYNM